MTRNQLKQLEKYINQCIKENNCGINFPSTKSLELKRFFEEEKELELLSEKILYSGVFIDADDLYSKAPSLLENRVKTPHITTCFRPKETDELNLNSLGKDVRISAIGYGNNGKNEGLLAKLESDDPETQKACDKIEKPFITLSLAPGARATDTGSLEFVTLDEPIEVDIS